MTFAIRAAQGEGYDSDLRGRHYLPSIIVLDERLGLFRQFNAAIDRLDNAVAAIGLPAA